MGLDMWAYKVSKVEDDTIRTKIKGRSEDDIRSDRDLPDVWVIRKREISKRKDMEDLIKSEYMSTTSVRFTRDIGIDEDIKLPEGINEEIKEIIEDRIMKHKEVEEQAYVIAIKEIGYWRKEYDLQDALYEMYNDATGKDIENCGYHKCTREMVEAMKEPMEYDGLTYEPTDEEIDEGRIFYHEWY